MKKYLSILMVIAVLFSFAACSNNAKSTKTETTANTTEMQKTENTEASASVSGKTLVVYFGVPEDVDTNDVDAVAGASIVVKDGEKVGNIQYVADIIQKNTGADLFRIEPETPYTTDHEDLVDLAKEEQNSNARPQIKNSIENFEQYDTVFVGYPNWWGNMPQIIYTFFDAYDFTGKTIIPYNTHGGSGFSNAVSEIQNIQPDATVLSEGYKVTHSRVSDVTFEDIEKWVDSVQ